jgi:hypothetical protein
MSAASINQNTKVKLPLPAVGAIALSLIASGGSIAVAKYRIDDAVTRLEVVEAARAADRELLVRIDERTAETKRILLKWEEKNSRP